jgi:hypothetical protein
MVKLGAEILIALVGYSTETPVVKLSKTNLSQPIWQAGVDSGLKQ